MTRCTGVLLLALVINAAGPGAASAQNAALRYWTAFAQLQNQPGAELAEELAQVESGRVPFAEARHGAILDANAEALATLLRASQLPVCDWGLEFELGPAVPVEYLARARAIARLNTLDGIRRAARGDSSGAVERWIAGVRFSQHTASGGTLLALLSGWTGLRSTFGAIERAETSLSAPQRRQLADAIRAIPETGFVWDAAWRNEQRLIEVWVSQLSREKDFRGNYERTTGSPPAAGLTLPSAADVAAFNRFMSRVADALALSPDTARPVLKDAVRDLDALHDFFAIPQPLNTNDRRAEVKTARDRLLASLSK